MCIAQIASEASEKSAYKPHRFFTLSAALWVATP